MRGQVLEVDAAGGLILADDGGRYRFGIGDWRGAIAAGAGVAVDFVAVGEAATEVFALPGQPARAAASPASPRPAAPAQGNSVLLGWLGIACLVLSFVVPVLPTLAALILGLAGASSARTFANADGLVLSRIAWIGALVLLVAMVALLSLVTIYAWPMVDLLIQYVVLVMREGSGG